MGVKGSILKLMGPDLTVDAFLSFPFAFWCFVVFDEILTLLKTELLLEVCLGGLPFCLDIPDGDEGLDFFVEDFMSLIVVDCCSVFGTDLEGLVGTDSEPSFVIVALFNLILITGFVIVLVLIDVLAPTGFHSA